MSSKNFAAIIFSSLIFKTASSILYRILSFSSKNTSNILTSTSNLKLTANIVLRGIHSWMNFFFKFLNYFIHIHFDQAFFNIIPSWHIRYSFEHGLLFRKLCAFLDLLDILCTAELDLLLLILVDEFIIMHTSGWDVNIANEFTRAEEEWEEVVLIQAPNAMNSSRLEFVSDLQVPDEENVKKEDVMHYSCKVVFSVVPGNKTNQQYAQEVQLVTRPVVKAFSRTEALQEIILSSLS